MVQAKNACPDGVARHGVGNEDRDRHPWKDRIHRLNAGISNVIPRAKRFD
jgi:hypothetical protein